MPFARSPFQARITRNEKKPRKPCARHLRAVAKRATDRQIEQAKDTALNPIRRQVADREEEAREEAMSKEVLAYIHVEYSLPWGTPQEEKQAARKEAEEAVSTLPASTPKWQLERARDTVIDRYKAKQRLIDKGLAEVQPYAEKLRNKYDGYDDETAWDIAQRVKPEVEKALREKLKGAEGEQQVIDRVRHLVKQLEGWD